MITEHLFQSNTHSTRYLADGPTDGPLIIFVHGWPELSQSWRHQLPFFAGMGFRAIAPDMRGYGGSTVYDTHEAYAQEHAVNDMLALLEHVTVSTGTTFDVSRHAVSIQPKQKPAEENEQSDQ